MAIIVRKYNFVGGTTIDPLQVNEELDQLVVAHNEHDNRIDTQYYTKLNMETPGQSQLHWDNVIGKPNFADSSWKPSVATRGALPITGNVVGDQRVVLNDGDGKQAVYTCIAILGTVDQQWAKVGDVDWMTGEATREAQETARVTAEVNRVTAESDRVSIESIRVSTESARVSAETTRVNAESARNTAESSRVMTENNRVAAESSRVLSENDRVTAENIRATTEANRSHKGAYNPATSYQVGNEVSYQGSTYRCILMSVGNVPTNTTYWVLIASAGDMVKSVYDTNNRGQDIFLYMDNHKNNIANPHNVTAAQVGAITSVQSDTAPQLGGELNTNGKSIGGPLFDNGNSGTAKTIDWRKGNHQKITMTGNCVFTFTAPTNPGALTLRITQDGTGGRMITLPTYHTAGGSPVSFTTTANAVDILTMLYDGTNYHCQVMNNTKVVV